MQGTRNRDPLRSTSLSLKVMVKHEDPAKIPIFDASKSYFPGFRGDFAIGLKLPMKFLNRPTTLL